MKSLAAHMAEYSSYHRDARNRATHFIGVPAIIFSILIPMHMWELTNLGGFPVTFANLFFGVWGIYYVILHPAIGLSLLAVLSPASWYAWHLTQTQSSATALTIFGIVFVVGWIIQLVGHKFEGNKPALLNNLFQIFVAPLFLTAEVFFGLKMFQPLYEEVEERVLTQDFTMDFKPSMKAGTAAAE